MAPAASRTISQFLEDTQTKPEDYDLILTGDLGFTGTKLLYEILEREYHKDINGHSDFNLIKQVFNAFNLRNHK